MTTIEGKTFPKFPNKYHHAISEWMYLVESREIETCQEQKELMPLVREKLDREDVFIDNKKIEKVIKRSEKYFFTLHPFQKFFISFVVGVYYSDQTLVFDEYLFLSGRGTGKNGLISALVFSLPEINNINKYNVDIVANTKDQAQTSFEDVFDVIDESVKLQKHFKHTKSVITHKKSRSKIKYHTSNARTKDGLRPGAIIFDEIHEYENEDLINVFSSALGKVAFPRIFYLTTDGYIRGGFLDSIKDLVKRIFAGETKSSKLFPFIFKLDNLEEVHDKKNWIKAIPRLLYDKILMAQVEKEYNKALESPSKMIEFLTKRMNIPIQDAFAAVAEWKDILATEQEIPDLTSVPCVGGIDYADIRDFVSCGLLFRIGEKRYFIQHTFICHRSLRVTKFKFDIDRAVREGYATIINDDMVKPEYLAQWFLEQRKKYRIQKIAADSWRYSALKDKFEEYGIDIEQVRNGPITHGKIAGLVDSLFALKNIVFGKDFMMRWYTNNVYVNFDAKGNKTYEKIEPKTRKTDGFMAFIHALVIEPPYKKPISRPNKRLRSVVGN
ncbi:terminase TerL endonuclease subunit [Enterococcus sp. DIV1420a]|uniref:terminase TerL endonuclease subunit n=1 Tax=Enterococcus sp. DIV1420a TaxID=2774672 RepID=UPI003F23C1EB